MIEAVVVIVCVLFFALVSSAAVSVNLQGGESLSERGNGLARASDAGIREVAGVSNEPGTLSRSESDLAPDSRATSTAGLSGEAFGVGNEPKSGASVLCRDLCAHFRYLAAKRLKGWQAMERQRNRLRSALMRSPSVYEAINLACVVYGHCAELWRKARCESHLNPNARNGSEASGLFQFLPSTWRSTPFGGFSIWSPYANALAAGWMHGVAHRGNEWVCR